MSDQEDQEQQSAPKELREYADRMKAEADETRASLATLRQRLRTTGTRQAGLKAGSTMEEAVLAVAERDGIDDPDDIATVARVMMAEARGELEGV